MRHGLRVPSGDADVLAVAIGRLLADPHARVAIGERARARAAGAMSDASAGLYASVLGARA